MVAHQLASAKSLRGQLTPAKHISGNCKRLRHLVNLTLSLKKSLVFRIKKQEKRLGTGVMVRRFLWIEKDSIEAVEKSNQELVKKFPTIAVANGFLASEETSGECNRLADGYSIDRWIDIELLLLYIAESAHKQ